jgi:hypothetical protein
VAYIFTADGTVMAQPQKSTLIGGSGDATAVINDVIIYGQAKPVKPPKNPPDGYKPPPVPEIRGEAIAKDGSTFGPDSLGFPSVDFYAKEVSTLDHVRLDRTARVIAVERLRRRTSVAAAVTMDTAPVPYLNPFDRVEVQVPGYGGVYYVTTFSMPFDFTESQPMTVGYRRLVHRPASRHKT